MEIIKRSALQTSPFECIEDLIIPVLEEIGERWERGEVSLSQIYMSGRFCEEIIETMLPSGSADRKKVPRIAVGVLEDQHTLGKRILKSVILSGGYDVTDYGAGISAATLVNDVIRDNIDILLISTLMLPAALTSKSVIEQIKKVNSKTKVIVGGAPFRFDKNLWKEVGADAMGNSAFDTLGIIKNLIAEKNYET